MTPKQNHIHNGYQSGQPCYYKHGGRILFPSEIKADAEAEIETYPDLMIEDILAATVMLEPKRSERLRQIRTKIRDTLRRDLSVYLQKVRELKARRLDPDPPDQPINYCVYVAMSLKHNHLYNDYAQLMICEDHLAHQADLFASL